MTGNRKARRRANKLMNKTIDAYDLGGARYPSYRMMGAETGNGEA